MLKRITSTRKVSFYFFGRGVLPPSQSQSDSSESDVSPLLGDSSLLYGDSFLGINLVSPD